MAPDGATTERGAFVTSGAVIAESHVEEATLAWPAALGYEVAYGPDVEPETLAAERDEVKARFKTNLSESRRFSEMLQSAVVQYQNRAITSAQAIEELIALAKEIRAAHRRGGELGLSEDELAFYDALEANDSVVAVLGDETLKQIAQELVDTVKRNATIDWNLREGARARMRLMVKRLLRKYGSPPDKQEHATQLVLAQAELVCEEWAA